MSRKHFSSTFTVSLSIRNGNVRLQHHFVLPLVRVTVLFCACFTPKCATQGFPQRKVYNLFRKQKMSFFTSLLIAAKSAIYYGLRGIVHIGDFISCSYLHKDLLNKSTPVLLLTWYAFLYIKHAHGLQDKLTRQTCHPYSSLFISFYSWKKKSSD